MHLPEDFFGLVKGRVSDVSCLNYEVMVIKHYSWVIEYTVCLYQLIFWQFLLLYMFITSCFRRNCMKTFSLPVHLTSTDMVFYTVLVYAILFCCKSSLLVVSICYITILYPFNNYEYVSYFEFQCLCTYSFKKLV